MSPHHNLTGGKVVELTGKGSSWSAHGIELLGADVVSDKTLHAIHRRGRWPYSSVKQMAARLKDGEMDVAFSAHCGRKRKITEQDKEQIEKRVREVAPEVLCVRWCCVCVFVCACVCGCVCVCLFVCGVVCSRCRHYETVSQCEKVSHRLTTRPLSVVGAHIQASSLTSTHLAPLQVS